LPAIERVTYQRVNSTTRKFIGLIRTIRNDAILLNIVQRLAIDFDRRAWWVESQREFKLPSAQEEVPKKKKKKGEEEPPSSFVFNDKYSKKPIPFPGGVVCDGVYKEREGLRKEGIAYIHFFPNGFNDAAILYLNKEGASEKGYSLLIRPTSGRVDVYREYIQDLNAVK